MRSAKAQRCCKETTAEPRGLGVLLGMLAAALQKEEEEKEGATGLVLVLVLAAAADL